MNGTILTTERIEQVLTKVSGLTLGVLGDLFLDRYLDLDDRLTERSLETGLDAYQVVDVRPAPGAAGTILNNLVALGVGRVCPLAVIGDDGEGYELRRCLAGLRGVDAAEVFAAPGRRTPTYTKPMLRRPDEPVRELNRLDIHNRAPLPRAAEDRVLSGLDALLARVDALIVLDQVSLPDCGVVTERVRGRLAELGAVGDRFILADSRERIGLFLNVCLKPNQGECLRAVGQDESRSDLLPEAVAELARRAGRAVFCTRGERGQLVVIPDRETGRGSYAVEGFALAGPTDPVGAGDSTSAAIACAVAAGLTLPEAAAFGNLIASITVAQVGTTGTASPAQVRRRWAEIGGG